VKIKKKLTLGIVFLFIEFLVIALFGAYSIYSISQQSEKIMKDNNLSILYAENMLQTIDQINALQLAILFIPSKKNHGNELAGLYDKFEETLRKEADNVTEPGEKELLQALTGEYQSYKVSVAEIDAVKDKSAFYFQNLLSKHHSIKTKIYHISDLNMQAILKKNESVNRYERRSYVILTIIASICFLLSIVFIFNFPGHDQRSDQAVVGESERGCGGQLRHPLGFQIQQRVQGDGRCREDDRGPAEAI
jgi:NtrC-family two-component system sensor histidine kinase KinB